MNRQLRNHGNRSLSRQKAPVSWPSAARMQVQHAAGRELEDGKQYN
jgi:hypothetical protein